MDTTLSTSSSYEHQIKACTLDSSTITERLSTIGGLQMIKDDINTNIMLPLKYPDIFLKQKSILTPSRGILFCGPPGTGKTMLAKAIAAESGVPFIPITLSNIENKYYGESTKLLKAVFSYARKVQPCIVFFDEIDGFIRTRSDGDQACVYALKTEFLNLLDGMHTKNDDSFFVIGCTNVRNFLDPAIKRRLSKVYHIELPDESERSDILSLISDNNSALIRQIASNTKMFSGSDLKELHARASNERLKATTKCSSFIKKLSSDVKIQDVLNQIEDISEENWWSSLNSMLREKQFPGVVFPAKTEQAMKSPLLIPSPSTKPPRNDATKPSTHNLALTGQSKVENTNSQASNEEDREELPPPPNI